MTNESECPKLKPVRVPAEVVDNALSAARSNHLGPLRYVVSKFLKVLAKDPVATNEWLMRSLYGGLSTDSAQEIDEDLAVANELDTVLENLEKED